MVWSGVIGVGGNGIGQYYFSLIVFHHLHDAYQQCFSNSCHTKQNSTFFLVQNHLFLSKKEVYFRDLKSIHRCVHFWLNKQTFVIGLNRVPQTYNIMLNIVLFILLQCFGGLLKKHWRQCFLTIVFKTQNIMERCTKQCYEGMAILMMMELDNITFLWLSRSLPYFSPSPNTAQCNPPPLNFHKCHNCEYCVIVNIPKLWILPNCESSSFKHPKGRWKRWFRS